MKNNKKVIGVYMSYHFCTCNCLVLFLLKGLFCNAFHFYQPTWTTDLGLNDDVWYLGIELAHHRLNGVVVGDVSEINDEILDVVHSGITIFEQCSNVFQEPPRLSNDISLVDHLAIFVNACRTRNEELLLGREGKTSASFESDAVFMGRIQVVECLEVFLVFFLNVGDGKKVDAYCCMANRSGSSDTCTGFRL